MVLGRDIGKLSIREATKRAIKKLEAAGYKMEVKVDGDSRTETWVHPKHGVWTPEKWKKQTKVQLWPKVKMRKKKGA